MSYSILNKDTIAFTDSKGVRVAAIDAGESFALLYDAEDGCLLKHGNAEFIQAHERKLREGFIKSGHPELGANLVAVTVPVRTVISTPAILEEINACLEISGRVRNILARLGELMTAE